MLHLPTWPGKITLNATNCSGFESSIPAELMAELQAAANSAVKRIRDIEDAKKACEEVDQIREEIRQNTVFSILAFQQSVNFATNEVRSRFVRGI